MKINLIFLAVYTFLALSSCSKPNDPFDDVPYYRFTTEDRTKLLVSYAIDEELIYKNQDNAEIKFKIVHSITHQTGQYHHSGPGLIYGEPTPEFFYDEQDIQLQLTQFPYEHNNFTYLLRRFPAFSDYNVYPHVVGYPTFFGTIEFPYWNGYFEDDTFYNWINIDFNAPVISMTSNGVTYNKVRTINSNKTVAIQGPQVSRNVNVIYYDQNSGIIGFDDLDGKQWRLQ